MRGTHVTPRSVVVVGASLAGHTTAKALRRAGYAGRLAVVGDERHRPYDRPPLSKEYLSGAMTSTDLALEVDDEDLGIEWWLGSRAVALDAGSGTVTLGDDSVVAGDAVVVATGSSARLMRPDLGGVHTLRTLDDAAALRADLVPGARLVIIGAGFIGAEVASTAHALGLEVTIVEAAATPLAAPLGDEVGAYVAGLHARHGVPLLCGVPVETLTAGDDGRVSGVRLADGRLLPADLVVVGIGATPNTGWLVGSGLEHPHGLLCDAAGRTAARRVYGVGDCAAWFDPERGTHHRVEHWTDSRDRARVVAASVLEGAPAPERLPAPYFWSDQYGVKIQFAGRRRGDETVTVEAGSAEGGDLLAVYRRGGRPVAVLGMDQPRLVTRWRKAIAAATVAA